MVSKSIILKQLKAIHYKVGFRNNAEINELANIIMNNEIIHECVNGYYEGGYALLLITNERLLLVDKKPFQFLTIEDVRFTQINQIFYNNRLIGSSIFINLGMRNLRFTSYNKNKLRNLVQELQNLISAFKNLNSQDNYGSVSSMNNFQQSDYNSELKTDQINETVSSSSGSTDNFFQTFQYDYDNNKDSQLNYFLHNKSKIKTILFLGQLFVRD